MRNLRPSPIGSVDCGVRGNEAKGRRCIDLLIAQLALHTQKKTKQKNIKSILRIICFWLLDSPLWEVFLKSLHLFYKYIWPKSIVTDLKRT